MKKKVLSTILIMVMLAASALVLAGCPNVRPSQPWNENSAKQIWGIEDLSGDGGHTLAWSMRQDHAREVDSFDIRIYGQIDEDEWVEAFEITVEFADVYQHTHCCGGPSVFYYDFGDVRFMRTYFRIEIRSISNDRFSVWSTNTFYMEDGFEDGSSSDRIFAVFDAIGWGGEYLSESEINSARLALSTFLISRGFVQGVVTVNDQNQIIVKHPDVNDPANLFRILGNQARVEFRNQAGNVIITENDIVALVAKWDVNSGGYAVFGTLTDEGAIAFENATAPANHGRAIHIYAIVYGEQPNLISAPTIQSQIFGGSFIITGMASRQAAQSLVDQIMASKLLARLSLVYYGVVPVAGLYGLCEIEPCVCRQTIVFSQA